MLDPRLVEYRVFLVVVELVVMSTHHLNEVHEIQRHWGHRYSNGVASMHSLDACVFQELDSVVQIVHQVIWFRHSTLYLWLDTRFHTHRAHTVSVINYV